MAFVVTHVSGAMTRDPPLDALAELLDELDQLADSEHPDVAVATEDGWSLSVFRSGFVMFENVELDGPVRHMTCADRAALLALLTAFATGDRAAVEAAAWQPGRG
jgi:hypothetical protein